jgi:hypothetical protein
MQKQASFVGKSITCPKCKRPFVVQLEPPTDIERAAINNAVAHGESHVAKPPAEPSENVKRRRRKKQELREAAHKKIKDELRPFLRRLTAIAANESSSEEEVRRWCIDVLRAALDHEDGDIDTEMSALNQKIDIAIKHEGKVLLIIECKNIRAKLSDNVRSQAVMYAANKSADWAVTTNGRDWYLYRILPEKGHDPTVVEVFSVSLLDDDGLSTEDIERLYLLTKRALTNGETEREYHLVRCLDDQRIVQATSTDRVIAAARKELMESYRENFDVIVRLTPDDIRHRLKELTRPSAL